MLQQLRVSGTSIRLIIPHLVGVYCCLFIVKLVLGINLAAYCKKRGLKSNNQVARKRTPVAVTESDKTSSETKRTTMTKSVSAAAIDLQKVPQ